MQTITESFLNENSLNKSIEGFLKKHQVGRILKQSNAYKTKGIPVIQVLIYLIQLVFTKKSMYMNILNGTYSAGFGKDVVYRLLNSTCINWSKYLLQLAMSTIKQIDPLTGKDRINVLIVDDTLYERGRSQKVELLAKVHDHSSKGNKYKRGFRMLTLAWSDGVTFIPLLFRHLSSEKPQNRYSEIKSSMDKRSVGYKARLEAMQTAPEVLFSMLLQAKQASVPAKHVLFDSWFSFPKTIMQIGSIGYYVIGRLKNTSRIKYLYHGEIKTLKEIYDANKKRRGRSHYLLSAEIQLYNDQDEILPARIVFVRDRNNRKKWIAFVSTDLTLTEETIIQQYAKRWDIEVFFKMCKSYLNLAKEFQGLSYDSITAHTAVVMTRYIMLATDKRQNEDPRSFGELFYSCYEEVADISFHKAIIIMLKCLKESLSECFFMSKGDIEVLIDSFIDKLTANFKYLIRSDINVA